jgi:bifunctional enzyme CysN/CysC
VDTLHRESAETLALNEIGRVKLTTTQPLFFDAYQNNRGTGSFILVDPYSNNTVAAGMIRRAECTLAEIVSLRVERPSSDNVRWEFSAVSREMREERHRHKAAVLWFTGLPGSGKSTVARLLEQRLFALGCEVMYLDGDNMRHGLNGDLSFSPEDRKENIRRVAEVAKLAFDHGMLVLCAFVSPYAADRHFARSLLPEGCFIEIYVECDLDVAMQRDPKGLYDKARRGEVRSVTGVDEPYEPPQHAEITLHTANHLPEEHVGEIVGYLRQKKLLQA